MSLPKIARIDAIDFWRGFALVSIFVNHLEDNLFSHLTHRNFGISDAAELFVFLSGISVALAYGRRFLDGQVARAVRGVFRRVLTLYGVHIVVSLVGIAILATAAVVLDNDDLMEADPDREIFRERPLASVVGVFTLLHQFDFFNILPLYIAVLIVTPGLLVLARIDKRLMLAVSFVVYVAVRVFSLQMPTWPLHGGWYFNPFAWQFLFAIGLFVGLSLNQIPKCNKALFTLCLVAVAVSVFVATEGFSFFPDLSSGIRGEFDQEKGNLNGLRLAHFLALAYVVYHSGLTDFLRKTPIYAPLALMGRHSLAVFAAGALLVVVGHILMEVDIPEEVTGFFIAIAGVAIQYFVARVFEARATASAMPSPTVDKRV